MQTPLACVPDDMAGADEILGSMGSVSLAEIDDYQLLDRRDTKYVFASPILPTLLARLSDDYRVLSVEDTRLFQYRTLYFDTPDCLCLSQHHNRRSNRCKFRIRQYASTGTCFLEVKTKNHKGRTDKQRIPLDRFEDSLSTSSREFIESVAGQVPELTLQLSTSFYRITLVHRDQLERVTFDLEMEFVHGEMRGDLPGIVIAEVKQESDDRHSLLRALLRHAGIRPLRVSKYCLGSALLKPHLKCNRFKSKLRRIRAIA